MSVGLSEWRVKQSCLVIVMLPVLVILLVMQRWTVDTLPFTHTYSYMSQHTLAYTHILILHQDCFKKQALVDTVGQF